MIYATPPPPPASSITWQIFALATFLGIGIFIYVAYTAVEYRRIRHSAGRRKGEVVQAFRKVVVAFCWWMLPISFFIRTGLVILGFGDVLAGQIVFFSLAGTSVVGVIFVLVSLRFD